MEVFSIPHEDQHILYFPFHHTVLLGNAALMDLVHRANQGELAAWTLFRTLLGPQRGMKLDDSTEHALCRRQISAPFRPTSITLLLTDDCTLRCRYCYASGGRSNRTMPWDTVTGAIDAVIDNALATPQKTLTVNFHGGDAGAAWPLFVATTDYLRAKKKALGLTITTSVGTNGVLDDSQRGWLTKNIDSATLSADGPPAVHDRHRSLPSGAPSSDLVLRTMQHFDRANFPYSIRVTITAESVERMDEIATYLCTNSAAARIQMEPMFPRGRAADGHVRAPGAQDFVDNFRKARGIAPRFGRTLCYSGARLGVVTSIFCRASSDSCVLTPEGHVTSCYEVADAADPLASTFFYGRYDPQARRFLVDERRRERLSALSVLNQPRCEDCFCKWHCAGDCPAKVVSADLAGNKGVPDRCLINRELTKDQLLAVLANA